MPQFRKNIRTAHFVIGGYFVAFLLLVSTCDVFREKNALTGVVHYSGVEFAGSNACAPCHAAVADAHFGSAHFLTSRQASIESVKGSFDSGHNIFELNERLRIEMERTQTGLFQVAYADSMEVNRRPFDIIVGSGRKGQTYLYWDSNALYQLPASYYTPGDAWCNSPGYPPDQIIFNRNIQARCLECHTTFARTEKTFRDRETFRADQVMLGVDCERCHGPAGQHVNFHRNNPEAAEGRYVVNPARLTRQQRLDNCALCHSGIRDNFMPSFTFTVGDRLEDFSHPAYASDSSVALDVHGNQYGLLASSKCFRMSEMDCSSCHDVHARESDRLEIFSRRCMTCHTENSDHFCKQQEFSGLILSKNCIDCHMPALPSAKVFLQAPDSSSTTPFLVRTHRVAVYRDQIEKFLMRLSEESLP